jgi:hypothetical protein
MQVATKKYVDDKDTAQTGALNTHKASADHDERYYTETEVDGFAVKLTGNQSVAGIKTFSSSPVVPTPTTSTQAANKAYVDSQAPLNIVNDSITDAKLKQTGDNILPNFNAHLADYEIDAGRYLAGDGSDDSAAFYALYTNAVLTNRSIYIPQGTYKLNINIMNPKINIFGAGMGKTILEPFDLTKPCMGIGDGSTTGILQIPLSDLSLIGDEITATSDGIVINGAKYVYMNNVEVIGFGRDNVSITSGTAPTSYIFLDNFISQWARGNCLKVAYGTSYTSAFYLNNFQKVQGFRFAANRHLTMPTSFFHGFLVLSFH